MATLVWMSGTGNSLRAADWMDQELERNGCTVTRVSLDGGEAPRAALAARDAGTMLGLVMPTHAFTAPWPMLRFVWSLPRGVAAPVFVCMTRAGVRVGRRVMPGLEGTGLYLLAALLALKGWRVLGMMALDMPSNWTAFHPAQSPEACEAIVARARPKAEEFTRAMLEGRRWRGSLLTLFLGLLLLPVSMVYLVKGRFFLAKLFFANSKCNGCGLCAQRCPWGGVVMRGAGAPRPYWTMYCESCMRCMSYCPTEAVEAGWSWGVLLYAASTVSFSAWMAPWAGPLLEYAVFLVMLVVAYTVYWKLLELAPINRFFTWTTLTHYYRRYREGPTSLWMLSDR